MYEDLLYNNASAHGGIVPPPSSWLGEKKQNAMRPSTHHSSNKKSPGQQRVPYFANISSNTNAVPGLTLPAQPHHSHQIKLQIFPSPRFENTANERRPSTSSSAAGSPRSPPHTHRSKEYSALGVAILNLSRAAVPSPVYSPPTGSKTASVDVGEQQHHQKLASNHISSPREGDASIELPSLSIASLGSLRK